MRMPAGIAGHLLHPVLTASLTGLLVFSLLCDLISLGTDDPEMWSMVAFYTLAGGCVGVVTAAVHGSLELQALAGPAGDNLARWHMALHLAAIMLYAASIWARIDGYASHGTPLALSLIAVLTLSVAGWLDLVRLHCARLDATTAPIGDAALACSGSDEPQHKPAVTPTSRPSSPAPDS
jgi:uncharacterized membrane protein